MSDATSAGGRRVVSQKNKRKALWWLITPWIVFLVSIGAWAILTSFLSRVIDSASLTGLTKWILAFHWLNVFLGFIGIVSMIMALVGFIVACVLLSKKELDATTVYDERSGKGAASVLPPEVKGWNWGAAGFPVWWGMYHGVWSGLVAIVPIVGLVWWIVMGIKGSEWAWRSEPWQSVEYFKKMQRKWMPWGIAAVILQIVGIVFSLMAQG
jgi:hypothetical protein